MLRRFLVPALLAGLLFTVGCGDEKDEEKRPDGAGDELVDPYEFDTNGHGEGGMATSGVSPDQGALNSYEDAPPTALRFEDVTEHAGIVQLNHSGRPGVKDFLIEAVGPGPAWLDYDKDGLLDVYIPEGDVFDNYELGYEPDPERKDRVRAVLRRKEKVDEEWTDRLWRNNGDGTFTDVSEQAGIRDVRWSFGATAVDFDADGWMDIYVSNFGPNRLWRNNGDGTFTDVAEKVGLLGPPGDWSTCAAVGDIDGDDRLDFYVAAYADPAHELNRQRLKRNMPDSIAPIRVPGRDCQWRGIKAYCGPRGLKGQADLAYIQTEDGRFEERAAELGLVPRGVPKYGFTVLLFDMDEDGYTDVYVANDSEENFFFQQLPAGDGGKRFKEASDVLGVKYGYNLSPQASMGMCLSDINGDGLFDIFVTNFSHDYNNMYLGHRVAGGGGFYYKDRGLKVMGQPVFYDLSWGCGFHDFDNDGDLDLYFANGHVYKEIDLFEKTGAEYEQYNALFECMDPKTLGYREVGKGAQTHVEDPEIKKKLDAGSGMAVKQCSRGAAFADIDNDGDLDILITNMNAHPTVILNTSAGATERAWIKFELEQPGGNREALGATIEVRAHIPAEDDGPAETRVWRSPVLRQESFLGSNDPRIHVGLGEGIAEVEVSVIWPGPARKRTDFGKLPVRALYRLDRASGSASKQELKTFTVPTGGK